MQLSTAGGRLIICSDGVWDSLTAEEALDCCRGMAADAAASLLVRVCLDFLHYFRKMGFVGLFLH